MPRFMYYLNQHVVYCIGRYPEDHSIVGDFMYDLKVKQPLKNYSYCYLFKIYFYVCTGKKAF